MNLRKITSLTVLLSFVLLIVTSVVLYIVPQGRVAYWSNWQLCGLGKEGWGALHTNLGLLFVISALIHTAFNWKAMASYLKNRAKKMRVFTVDFNIALLITAAVTICTLFELPPMRGVQVTAENIKAKAAEKYGEPPYGHAELSSLKSFCRRTEIDVRSALEKMAVAGVACETSMRTIKEIALENGLTPQQVYELIRPEPLTGDVTLAFPDHPAPGFGRKTIAEFCKMYGIEQRLVVYGLRFMGKEVTADQSIREVAEANDMEPMALFEAIKSLAGASE